MNADPAARGMTPVPLKNVSIADRFWAPRLDVNRRQTIPHMYAQCKQTGRIDAFRLAWKPGDQPKPHQFWDSDVAKWVEAASYSLATHPDARVQELLGEVVELIAGAQQPDGYLNTYFTTVDPDSRWANLAMWHELYCAGHLIEAGVAHQQATGQRQLLDVVCRYADYIDSVFGPGKRDGCPGHEEIELALVKLYRATGEDRYLKLSRFFLDQRGQKPSFYQREMESLTPEQAALHRYLTDDQGQFNSQYCQDHLPVRRQSEVVGHAVCAMYLYSAMADVGMETGDPALLDACLRLWDNVTLKRMYVTGGIGPSSSNEGFTADYDLPSESAYAETCAAVGLVFWAHRLLQWSADGRFADIMERALYNGALGGISLDGKRFFYRNPLASRGDHHRQDWHGCACCPPNISRLVASLGQYVYSTTEAGAYVHLYVAGQTSFDIDGVSVRLNVETDYPWDGSVKIQVEPGGPVSFGLNLRIPGWCEGARIQVNGQAFDAYAVAERGYACVRRQWNSGDWVSLELPMPIRRVYAHPSVRDVFGCVALQRGPLVYCLEQEDNPMPLHRVVLPADAELQWRPEPNLLGGVTVITGEALFVEDADWGDTLYRTAPFRAQAVTITAIPYYAWDHRAAGQMRVWLHEA